MEQLERLKSELMDGAGGACISNSQEIIAYIDRHAGAAQA